MSTITNDLSNVHISCIHYLFVSYSLLRIHKYAHQLYVKFTSHYIFMSIFANYICPICISQYIFISSPEACQEVRRRKTTHVNWVGLRIQHVSLRTTLMWPESVHGSPRQPRPPSEEHFWVNKTYRRVIKEKYPFFLNSMYKTEFSVNLLVLTTTTESKPPSPRWNVWTASRLPGYCMRAVPAAWIRLSFITLVNFLPEAIILNLGIEIFFF